MCGAAYLSALTAYRAGAGLVKILTVEENRPILQGLLPEAIIASYTPDQLLQGREEFKEMIEEQMKWASVVVLGPGLGSEPYVEYLVEDILTSAYVPVILDADGLNTIASHPYLTSYYTENIIITPHLGEMARLTGQTISQLKEDLVGAASAYASRYGVTCVLKDAATVVAGQEGGLYINTSGCSPHGCVCSRSGRRESSRGRKPQSAGHRIIPGSRGCYGRGSETQWVNRTSCSRINMLAKTD